MRALKPSIVAVGLVLALIAPVAAGPFEDADAAFNRRNYATALKLLQPLADFGDARAQVFVGNMHWLGYGVPKDYARAVFWFRKAADQGDADGQYTLGRQYQTGYGVPKDYAQALVWIRKAADQGDADAQLDLGAMYDTSLLGVPQDFVRSHMWYNLAAGQGYPGAAMQRDDVAARMTPQQIAEAQKLASDWVAAHPPPQ